MIEQILFENFRGFEKLELLGLKPITLISGKNNAGKSSVLEGIFLFLDYIAPESFMKINTFRGLAFPDDSTNSWETVFYQMNAQKSMKITVMLEGVPTSLKYVRDDTFVPLADKNVPQKLMGQIITSAKSTYTLKFEYQQKDYMEEGHFIAGPMGMIRNMTSPANDSHRVSMPLVYFINATIINSTSDSFIAEWLGKLELEGRKKNIVEILRLIEPAVDDLTTLVVNGNAQLFVKMSRQLLPLRLVGDGLNKLLFILLTIAVNPHSVVLVDEIETGFHYSMFPQLWETIARTAFENDCQVIATTHSYECIVGAVDGIEKANRSSAFCYYRLDKNREGNYAYRYSDDLLQTAVTTDMEVR